LGYIIIARFWCGDVGPEAHMLFGLGGNGADAVVTGGCGAGAVS